MCTIYRMERVMNLIESVKNLNKFERCLWLGSMLAIVVIYIFSPDRYWLTILASLVGITALIFLAKGDAMGQLLTIVFSVLYSLVSFKFRYFGEIFTYLGMTAPTALVSMIVWIKNPYKAHEVKVSDLKKSSLAVLVIVTLAVTLVFYYILKACDTSNLIISTVSIATSFLASGLMVLRSPYYAVAYAANDIVLIILWVLASVNNIEYLPMVLCFIIFFINDLYGFWNWRLMKVRQESGE